MARWLGSHTWRAVVVLLMLSSCADAFGGEAASPDPAWPSRPTVVWSESDAIRLPPGSIVRYSSGPAGSGSAMGRLLATAYGGDNDVARADASTNLTTYGGPVDVTIAGDDPQVPREVTITAYGGDVTLRLRNDPSVDLDICVRQRPGDSRRYRVTSDFALDRSNAIRRPASALFRPRAEQRARAVLGDGRHRVRIVVEEGNVRLVRG